jgi:hypothetical protein
VTGKGIINLFEKKKMCSSSPGRALIESSSRTPVVTAENIHNANG